MKTFRFIGMALFAVLMCVNFTSCSGGDDDPTEEPEEIVQETVGGVKDVLVPHGCHSNCGNNVRHVNNSLPETLELDATLQNGSQQQGEAQSDGTAQEEDLDQVHPGGNVKLIVQQCGVVANAVKHPGAEAVGNLLNGEEAHEHRTDDGIHENRNEQNSSGQSKGSNHRIVSFHYCSSFFFKKWQAYHAEMPAIEVLEFR